MFGIDSAELIIVALAALIFIGPKELPGALRAAGRYIAHFRAQARHLTGGFGTLMREAELAEMEAEWRANLRQEEAKLSAEAMPASADGIVVDRSLR